MSRSIRFGTLGAAAIAPGALIVPASEREDVEVVAVAARDPERARDFSANHGVREVMQHYRDVIEHPDVDAVYNPLPIHLHKEWSVAALRAGKHVLCEKPFACNAHEALEMAEAAAETGLVLMEARHSRHHPVFQRAREIVASGDLGEIESVRGWSDQEISQEDRIRHQYRFGGGALMDLGVYPITWARFVLGEAPVVVSADAETGNPNVDVTMTVQLAYPSGATGMVRASMFCERAFYDNVLEVRGSRGLLRVLNPMVPQYGHKIEWDVDGEKQEEKLSRRSTYAFQLDAFVNAVVDGSDPLTGPDDAIAVMRLIDDSYRAAGLPIRGLDLA